MIRCMRIACWITKAADKHSEYVIFICLSRAKPVRRTYLSVTFNVHCLSCYPLTEDNFKQYGRGRVRNLTIMTDFTESVLVFKVQ